MYKCKFKFSAMSILKILVVIFFLYGCSKQDSTVFKPFVELNGLKLSRHISGEEARELINQLHNKSVTPSSNDVLFYEGLKGKATLYVSIYKSDADTKEAYDKMVRLIKDGNQVFGHFHEMEIETQPLSMCLGMGQAHYFFAKDNKLYWLSTNYEIAQATVFDLLNKLK